MPDPAAAAPPSFRQTVHEALDDEEWPHPGRRWIHHVLIALIVLSVIAAVIGTIPAIQEAFGFWLTLTEIVCVGLFTVEYGVRVWTAVEDRAGRYEHPLWGRLRYMATPMALIDLMAILPTYLALLLPGDFLLLRTLRILRVLKITRYSRALATFEIVLVNERRSLLAAGSILAVALLLAAGAMHHIEGELTSCKLLELRAGDFHRLLAGDAMLRQAIQAEVKRRTDRNLAGEPAATGEPGTPSTASG